ncbi:MAG: exo-alpha-sialidase [Candidatus Limnocylindria bacterium]
MVSSLRLRGAALAAAAILLVGAAAPPSAFRAPLRLGFPAGDDWEPAIAADRAGHMYVLYSHYGNDPACPGCASPHSELQVSGDGGATWSTPRPIAPSRQRQDDPQIVVDPADGRTVYAAFMQGNKASQYVARSTDFGRTWRVVLTEHLERGTDKEILAVRGKDVYLAYHAGYHIFVSASHDGGRTWTVRQPLESTRELGESLGSGGTVDSEGRVYFAWNGVERPARPKGPINLYITTSARGGRSWRTSVIDVSQIARDCRCGGWDYWGAQMALAVDGRDNVYLLWNANRRPGAPQRLYFARSTNHGVSWTRPVDVSPAPYGANNVFPAIVATGNGDVRIGWMDDRRGHDAGGNDPTARWNTFTRSSKDGGRTWSTDQRLSTFVPGYAYLFNTGFLQPYGDYFEMEIDGTGQTHAIWGAGNSYAGPGNVWYTRSR